MKRRHGVGVGVAAIVIALLLWRHHGNSESAGSAAGARTTGAKVTAGATGSPKRPDPRTLRRASIAGTIRTETNTPIAQARVCIDTHSNDLPTDLTRDPRCTETGTDGHYRFDNLYQATYTISAGARTYRPGVYHPKNDRKKSTLELAAGQAKTDIDIILYGGGVEITGVVNDISGGPVAHAQVRASGGRWARGPSSPVAETDERGTFSLWVRPGSVYVTATADGYADSSESGQAPGTVEILLTPESSLAGTVVDAKTGKPIEGAKVTVGTSEWGWDNGETDRSDAQGKFRVARLTPGRYVASARTEHGYGRTEGSTLVGLGQHVEDVVVRVFPAHRIEGKVMISGTTPTVCIDGSASFHDTIHSRWVTAETDPDGTIHAEGVLPGTYKPQVWCRDYQPRDDYEPIVIADNDATGLVWEVAPGATIRGKVLTKTGEPIEGASIDARTTGGNARDKTAWGGDTSTRDGSFEMKGLKAASYRLEVTSDRGIGPKDGFKVDVAAGATVTQDLILDDGGTIAGTVVDAEGKPVRDVTVDARALEQQLWWGGQPDVKSDAGGAFKITPVRAGDYRVTATRGNFEELRKPGTNDDAKQGEKVSVKAAQTVTVKLVVESQNGTIKGTVVDPDGKPVSDAFISTARESDAAGSQDSNVAGTRSWGWGDNDKPVLTSVDGTFVVGNLSKGKYTLRAYRKGGGEAVAEHVVTGSNAKLQIKRTGSIEGTVRRDGGPPPDEINLTVQDLKTGFHRQERFYMTAGHFLVHDLPQGHFHLAADAEGGQKKLELDLADSEAKTGIELVLDVLVTLTGRMVEFGTQKPVPGIQVFAQLAQGGNFAFAWNGDDRDNISDETGRFTVKRVPRGALSITGMAKDWQDSDYNFFHTMKTVAGTGTIDVGDLGVVKKRVKEGDPVGELGVHFAEMPNDTPPEKYEWKVSWIDPAGPAAKVDLKVGDIFVTVDGVDMTGANATNGYMLTRAAPGTKLTFGLKRGVTVAIILAAP